MDSAESAEACQPSSQSLLAFLRQAGSEGWVRIESAQSPRSEATRRLSPQSLAKVNNYVKKDHPTEL